MALALLRVEQVVEPETGFVPVEVSDAAATWTG